MLQPQSNRLNHLLESRRLISVMNQTKWRKLVGAMSELQHIGLLIRVKYLNEEEPTAFAPIWWDQLEVTGFEWIEWLEISTTTETHVGLLAPELQTDYADLLQDVLDRSGVPHKEVNSVYRILGYTSLN